ncbi:MULTISPECIES: hypothetical protein [unclassified Campylobacter]|uniref:hypothetical protein n=1 Tax=unclassified Campylobacter TaxID=2593542 RepID=UPI003D34411E
MRILAFISLFCLLLSAQNTTFKQTPSKEQIDMLKNPFKIIKNDTQIKQQNSKKQPNLRLNAILATKAKINNKWLNLGEVIGGFKLVQINKNSVILKSTNETRKLKISKENRVKIK